jgi:hypothetical protein
MSVLDKIKGVNPKESLTKGFNAIKGFLIAGAILVAFTVGFIAGVKTFETGHLVSVLGYKNTNAIISGVCKFSNSDDDRFPALLDDMVKVNAVDLDKKTISIVVRKTREDLICDLEKISISQIPLGDKILTPPEITAAVPIKKQDPFWKLFEKKTVVISGTCTNSKGDVLPNLIDEKVEVVSTSGSQEEGQFVLTGLKRSDRLSIICSSKLITYKIYDASMEPKEVVKEEVPVDFTGSIVLIDSKCMPDPKYLKDRKMDPKTKKLIGRVPKFYNLLNTPVQVLSYKTDESKKITYLEGKIVDQSSSEAYGKKIICDSKVEALVVKYDTDKTNSLINKQGEEVNTRKLISNLEVVSEGDEEVVKPKVQVEDIQQPQPQIDDKQRLNDLIKELDK